MLKESQYFELSVIVLPLLGIPFANQRNELLEMKRFFVSKGIPVDNVFNEDTGAVIQPSEDAVGDLLFYQQPWSLPKGYKAEDLVDKTLLCYIPYYVPNYGNLRLECS